MTFEQTGRGPGGRQNPNRPSEQGEGRSPDERTNDPEPGAPAEKPKIGQA